MLSLLGLLPWLPDLPPLARSHSGWARWHRPVQTWKTTRSTGYHPDAPDYGRWHLEFVRCGNGQGNPFRGDRWQRKNRRFTGRLNPKKHRRQFTHRPNHDLAHCA